MERSFAQYALSGRALDSQNSEMQQSVLFTPGEIGKEQPSFPYELRVISVSEKPCGIFRLRHAYYCHEGWIASDSSKDYCDACDASSNTVHLAAFRGKACVGATRLSIKSWTDSISVLPCASSYPALRSAGLRKLSIAELSHLVVDPGVGDSAQRAALMGVLVRGCLLAVQATRVAMLVSAARPEWLPFYKTMLSFHIIDGPATYPPAPMALTLVGGNMIDAGRRATKRSPFFKTLPTEVSSMHAALSRCLVASANSDELAARNG